MRLSDTSGKASAAAIASLDSLNDLYALTSTETLLSSPTSVSAKPPASPAGAGRPDGDRLNRWHKLTVASNADPRRMAGDYGALSIVETAQPNYLIPLAAGPNDPLFQSQWNLLDLGYGAGSEISYNRVDRASVLVGLIDSGMDYTHPDIAGHIWQNRAEVSGEADFDDDGNGYVDDVIGWDFSDAPNLPGEGDYLVADADPMDESGHGTHVGGIIAAGVDNGIGIAGVASAVELMVLRAAVTVAGRSFLENDAIAAAIIYAVDNGAQILNFSFGSPQFSPLIQDAVRYAADAGVVLVAAVGNEASEEVFYPARHKECIAVAASDINGRIAAFSNHGFSVDVAAPGERIQSLAPGAQYASLSGTSMSAGHVSGLAAVWLSHFPHLTALQIWGAIATSTRDVAPAGWDSRAGAGIVRVPDQFIQAPLAVRLSIRGDARSDERELEAHLTGSGSITYELNWAAGSAPAIWTPLGRGAVGLETAGSRAVEKVVWKTAGLADGSYIVGVSARMDGWHHEDFLEVILQRDAVELIRLDWFRELAGPVWQYVIEWTTSKPTGALVHVSADGADEPTYELPVEAAQARQSVVLPADLAAGTYAVDISFDPDHSTLSGTPLGLEIGPRGVVRWQLNLLGLLPAGFLMPGPSDFDNDRLPEIVQMVAGGGGSYNTASFYEVAVGEASGFTTAHTTARSFIPWSQHDLDNDGKLELMAVDAERVRIIESAEAGLFPSNVIWERRDVWGGETADLDADGKSEMYLRSSRASQFRVFESVADDEFVEIAVFAHPFPESAEFGDRQVVGDLDGDGWGELLSGDDNGNLLLFESIADNAYRLVWSEVGQTSEPQRGDRRVIGGGTDLDGDGRSEFVSCEFIEDLFEFDRNRWRVQVYEAIDDDEFGVEWSIVVNGGKASGNGIAVGDIDGDGTVEVVMALVPDMYVLRALEGEYEVVWHSSIEDVHRPLIADLNGDGASELGFNSAGSVRVYSVAAGLTALLPAPGRVRGVPVDEGSALVQWEPVAGAVAYRVYRSQDGEISLRGELGAADLAFTDRSLSEGARYEYTLAAVDSTGAEGYRSAPINLQPESVPELLEIEQIASRQLGLRFDRPMGDTVEDAYRYWIDPDVGRPSSAVRDGDGSRVVLGFSESLPDSGMFRLRLQGLRSHGGTALPVSQEGIGFELKPLQRPAALLGAEAISEVRVIVRFDAPLDGNTHPLSAFAVDSGKLRVVGVARGSSDSELILELDGDTPLRKIGRRYFLEVTGLTDGEGLEVTGTTFIQLETRGLDDVTIYPNPFDPSKSEGVTFAHLPAHTAVHIINLAGEGLRSLEETDGDGGVLWDGLDESGQLAGNGIYFYQLVNGNDVQTGKFAIVGGR